MSARCRNYACRYWVFAVAAAIGVAAVIVGPWLFTLAMSVLNRKVSEATPSVGLANSAKMLARTIFVLPMMADPVAITLVWTMMFHPQSKALDQVRRRVGLPRFACYDLATDQRWWLYSSCRYC